MFFRKVVERDHALPVALEGFYRRRVSVSMAGNEGVASCLSLLLRLGVGDLRQQRPGLALRVLGQVVEDVDDLVIPIADVGIRIIMPTSRLCRLHTGNRVRTWRYSPQ